MGATTIKRQHLDRVALLVSAAFLAISTTAGLAAASPGPAGSAAMPLVLPETPVSCEGALTGGSWDADRQVVILAGAACPRAAFWLRADDGHGAGAGDGSQALVDWIRDPSSTEPLEIPGWHALLPGRSETLLRAATRTLNDSWAGRVIVLALYDSTRGTGDGREAHLAALQSFRLTQAYLDRPSPACGAGGRLTCLVGAFLGQTLPSPTPTDCGPRDGWPDKPALGTLATGTPVAPTRAPVAPSADGFASVPVGTASPPASMLENGGGADRTGPAASVAGRPSSAAPQMHEHPRPTPRPHPTRPPHPTPAPRPTRPPCPSGSPSPSPTASVAPSPSASGSPAPSGSGSPSPSPTRSPGPSPSGSAPPSPAPSPSQSSGPSSPPPSATSSAPPTPTPTGTPPPSPFLRISIATPPTIQLVRGMLNATTVVVQVSSDGAWHVSTAALDTDPARGYMHLDSSAATTLASPMQVLVRSGQPVSLAGSDPVRVGQGSGSASLGVVLEQSIGPADTPGTYTIELVFSAISGF